jgi:hypothetical protein
MHHVTFTYISCLVNQTTICFSIRIRRHDLRSITVDIIHLQSYVFDVNNFLVLKAVGFHVLRDVLLFLFWVPHLLLRHSSETS